jgi:hypothetical protein
MELTADIDTVIFQLPGVFAFSLPPIYPLPALISSKLPHFLACYRIMIELETLNDPERTAKTKTVNSHAIPASASAAELTATPQSQRLNKDQRLQGRIQFATLCVALFMAGWNDGSSGPLLPRIQEVYQVNFTVVSLIFVCSCSVRLLYTEFHRHPVTDARLQGFVAGAVSNIWLTSKLGFGKVCQVTILGTFSLTECILD